MIRRLRAKPRVDRLPNETRRPRPARFGRRLYLLILFGFFLWLADLIIAPMLRLEAKGLVIADLVSVGVPFAAQVESVSVTSGATVHRGDVLARVSSVDLSLNLATLTARNAELVTRRAEMERRARIAQAILPIARDRALQADQALHRIRDIRDGGHVSLATWSAALAERSVASERVAELQAEARVTEESLAAVDDALGDAMNALSALDGEYADGIVTAPNDGIIGLNVAQPGTVLTLGQPMMVLYPAQRFVLAYLETGTLYSVAPGDAVSLSDGFNQSTGRVSEILPMAEQLPEEFRKVFQPRERNQIARIALTDPNAFPLLSTVTVYGIGWLSPGSVIRTWLERMFRPGASEEAIAGRTSEIPTAAGY